MTSTDCFAPEPMTGTSRTSISTVSLFVTSSSANAPDSPGSMPSIFIAPLLSVTGDALINPSFATELPPSFLWDAIVIAVLLKQLRSQVVI
jgi:hypothetical protein